MSAVLREKINETLKSSIKSREEIRTATMRLLLAALKDRDIAARSKGNDKGISDDEVLSLIQTMIKQRHESATAYKNAGRAELAARELQEITVLEDFLPPQMSDEEIEKLIIKNIVDLEITGIRDMGRIMAELKQNYAGQMDFSRASQLVRDKLSQL